jgi:hypothetical protein
METVHKFISHGKHYGNVLVHCMRGVSRSASFVMGHLMMDRELTLLEAVAHVKACRSVVQPNEAFMLQLRKLDEKLQSSRDQHEENNKEEKAMCTAQGPAQRPQCSSGSSIGVALAPTEGDIAPTTTTTTTTSTTTTTTDPLSHSCLDPMELSTTCAADEGGEIILPADKKRKREGGDIEKTERDHDC